MKTTLKPFYSYRAQLVNRKLASQNNFMLQIVGNEAYWKLSVRCGKSAGFSTF